jgi:hypothetical protein
MSQKLVNDLIESLQLDETYKLTSDKLNAEQKQNLEASVREIAELMVPFLNVVEALSNSEEAMLIAKTKLSEKPVSG